MKKTECLRVKPTQKPPKFPRPLTKRVIEKIASLESSLRVRGFESGWQMVPTWNEVLEEYRTGVAMGLVSPRFVQRYGAFCLAAVEALEEASKDRRGFDPLEWMTSGHLSKAEALSQSKKSEQATLARQERAEVQRKRRKEVLTEVIEHLSKSKSFDLATASYAVIYRRFELEWPAFHRRLGILPERIDRTPALNTIKPIIDEVRR